MLFRPLGPEQIRCIVDIQYARIEALARRNQNLALALSDAARAWLAEQGYDPTFGARPLKRLLQQEIANKLAAEILAGRIADGDGVHIDLAPDGAGLDVRRGCFHGGLRIFQNMQDIQTIHERT